MSGKTRAIATLPLLLVLGLGWGQAWAQDGEAPEVDPPDRAARLSFIEGDVSMQPAGEEEWAPAILDRPLTTGDRLWTERGARAEIYVGPAAVRVGPNTGFSFLNVDDNTIQMRMTAGVITVNVRALDEKDHIEIDTPNVALLLLRAGSYRVEVNDAGDATTVKVREGEVDAIGPSQKVNMLARQVVTFSGTEKLTIQWSEQTAPDEFDSWSRDREARYVLAANSRTAEYVSPDVTGYEELEESGTWSSEPEYGYVWTPTHVAADWSPYRYGRWLWVSPWGWTWIDDARWGYAPSHYGRWAHVRQRWCWVPGPRHARAVYAPAQVGWVGGGRVAWFPLGPNEVYVPGRPFSRRYLERVNVTNTEIVKRAVNDVYTNRARNVTYRNRAVAGAVTAVSRATFTSAGRVGDHRVRVNELETTRAAVTALAPQIAPVRESRLGGETRVNVRTPPRTVVDRQVVVQREPPPTSHGETWRAVADAVGHQQNQRQPDLDDHNGAVILDRSDRAPRAQPPVPGQSAWVHGPREVRARESRAPRPDRDPQARVQQEQRDSEVRQSWQQQYDQARQRHEQQRQQQDGVRYQRPPDTYRSPAPRQSQPRVEQRQQQVRPSQPAVQRPAVQSPPVQRPTVQTPAVQRPAVQRPTETQAPRQQGNHSRPQRN